MAGATMVKDLVCGMTIDPKTAAATRVYEGTTYYFCAQGCAKAFDKDPKKYIQAKN
jgi:P-type Cu+ transporter